VNSSTFPQGLRFSQFGFVQANVDHVLYACHVYVNVGLGPTQLLIEILYVLCCWEILVFHGCAVSQSRFHGMEFLHTLAGFDHQYFAPVRYQFIGSIDGITPVGAQQQFWVPATFLCQFPQRFKLAIFHY
jgi:hypothetical protein